jgi:hypothetical protein
MAAWPAAKMAEIISIMLKIERKLMKIMKKAYQLVSIYSMAWLASARQWLSMSGQHGYERK